MKHFSSHNQMAGTRKLCVFIGIISWSVCGHIVQYYCSQLFLDESNLFALKIVFRFRLGFGNGENRRKKTKSKSNEVDILFTLLPAVLYNLGTTHGLVCTLILFIWKIVRNIFCILWWDGIGSDWIGDLLGYVSSCFDCALFYIQFSYQEGVK